MRARERVSTQLRDERQIEIKLFSQPIHAGTASLGQHLGERNRVRRRFGVSNPGRALDNVIFKFIRAVWNVQSRLRSRERSINPARRLRTVSSQEGTLVEQDDARAAFDDGVRRGQSRETTAYYDDLFRHIARRAHADTNDDEWRTKIKSDCGALS